MNLESLLLAGTIIFFVFAVISAIGKNPVGVIASLMFTVAFYLAWNNNQSEARIELNDGMTKNERLSALTGQSVEDLEEADQRLIEKGLLIPSNDQ